MRIALAGNPNSGKTTMFNALTGTSERVGNWAGVTVDKKEHRIKTKYSLGEEIIAVDLPGAYSMSPFTSDEGVTRDYVTAERPDVILNIVDADNLSRSLFFTTQLLELGIPTVIALNKVDLNRKHGIEIDVNALASKLGCPVVTTVSTSSDGLDALMVEVMARIGKEQSAPYTQGDIDLSSREAVACADKARFDFVNGIVRSVEIRRVFSKDRRTDDKIDVILTNRWLGIPIFAVVMFFVFYISQSTLGAWIADGVEIGGVALPGLVPILETFQGFIAGLLENAHPLIYAILVDGVIGGVVAVVGFLPLVMVMYFLIALLEDSGYMSRAAVVLDPIFKRVGLSGKSVIPFVITVGCAVPGIMASRTIKNERERRATAMLAPFMPCGAKIPVIALFAGAFFDNAWWVSALMYFAGIALIFLGALLVNLVTGYKASRSFFIIELPEYKAPSVRGALRSTLSRGKEYIVKAATIILLCNMAVHLMQSFTFSLSIAESASDSILAIIATPFAYILAPIVGVVAWQLAAAVITGFIAKENVVGTLAVCFVGLENLIDTEELAILEGAGAEVAGMLAITKVAALAYLMFNLFTPPCFAAIGAMNAELKSKKWLIGGIGLQLAIGYTLGFLVFFFGTIFTGGSFSAVWMPIVGWTIVILFAVCFAVITIKNSRDFKGQSSKKVQL